MIQIKKGLDLPINGAPEQKIYDGKKVDRVALVGFDYHGMKPTMAVREGDRVQKGQLLFTDKKTAGIRYTSPASGVVTQVNRGDKRVFQSLVIEVEGDDQIQFQSYSAAEIAKLNREQVVEQLVESGLWTALRTRPFSMVPALDAKPSSVFVTAMDTNPLAANPELVIAEKSDSFLAGLQLLSTLAPKLFVCKAAGAKIPSIDQAQVAEFAGVHPAGLVGTHIHFLDPVGEQKSVWHLGYQDVIAFGELFLTGKIYTDRVISLAGPLVKQPRLVRTQLGADLNQVVAGELNSEHKRIISGSVFGGRTAKGPVAYLGRYANQVSVLLEGDERVMFRYLRAGFNLHSVMPIFASAFNKLKKFDFNTTTNGSARAMVPIGQYEKVMPLDILPTQLLRAICVGDLEMAIKLGALELDEEDLALCTYACIGKYEYGPILRDNLTRILKEG